MVLLSIILPYIIIIAISFTLSFVIKGLIDKFIKEEEMYEAYEEEHKEELSKKLTKEETKFHKNEINKLKTKFVPTKSMPIFIASALLESVLFYIYGCSVQFFMYSFLTMILIISFVTDLKSYIIPNETNFVGGIIGFIYAIGTTIFYKLSLTYRWEVDLLLGGIAAALIFAMIGGISFLVLKKEGMGGGDIKLVVAIGFIMGLKNFIQIFVVSFLIAALVSLFLLITKKKDRTDYIPFGPFLCIGTYITMLIPAMLTATTWMKLLMQ